MSGGPSQRRVDLHDGFTALVDDEGPRAVLLDGDLYGSTDKDSLTNFANLRARGNPAFHVLKAKVLVTGACNQRCYYCSVAADWQKPGLSTDDLARLFHRLADAGVLHVQLHGGDVSVRKDLATQLGVIDEREMISDFFTNASGAVWRDDVVYETIDRMSAPPFVTISLLAGDPDVHDRLAGARGAFAQMLETVDRLRAVGAPVRFSISLTRESLDQLGKAQELARSLGARLSIINEVYASVANAIDTRPMHVTRNDILGAREDVLGDRVVELQNKRCSSGITSVTIDHDGHLVGCDRNVTQRFGSVLEEDLADLVAADAYRTFVTSFYRRPSACDTCPDELSQFCNWCPATPFNYDLPQDEWLDFHCTGAMKRRLFWTGRDDPVEGSRASARTVFESERIDGVRAP